MSAAAGPKTAFVGLSHLGINYSLAWASFGQDVVGCDLDADVVERLKKGQLPVLEPGLPELFARARPFVGFSTDFSALAACDLVVLAKDVPTDEENASDLGPVLDLWEAALPHVRPGSAIAVMSQAPPGFMRRLRTRLDDGRPGASISLFYWVETLIFGDAVRRALQPERIIIGCLDPATPLPAALARGLERFGCPVLPMSYESAELTKTAINLYLIGSVTYANSLADLCERIGADWSEIVPALRLDKRIGPSAYLKPSLGVAGGNLERDLVTVRGLCRERGVDTTYLDALTDYNGRRLGWVQSKLDEIVFASADCPTIGVWGLTYKRDTRSTKNSPALRVIAALQGRARLRAWDPVIRAEDVRLPASVMSDPDAAAEGADCLLVMADWPQFASADLGELRQRMRRPIIIDCVGILEDRRSDMAGIQYVSMGRSC